jgi:Surface-adhesin protein E
MKDMYRGIAVALIMLLPVVASAADWQVIADTRLGQLKMDKTSVSREGKYTAAVLVYEFKALQSLTPPPHHVFNRRQDDLLVNCDHPSLGIHTSRFFEDDRLSDTYTREVAKVRFKPAKPDTMAAKVVEAVCAAAKSKP